MIKQFADFDWLMSAGPALTVDAGILMPCHDYMPVLIEPLPALYIQEL